MIEMSKEELDAFYQNLERLAGEGSEQEVTTYITENFDRLPLKLQNELIGGALLSAVRGQAEAEKAESQMYEEGLAAADALEKLRGEIKEGD